MKTTFRTPITTVILHWIVTLTLLGAAVTFYIFVFVLAKKPPVGKMALISFAVAFFVGIAGLIWGMIAAHRTLASLQISEEGLVSKGWGKPLLLPWEDAVGLSYHCATTRIGRDTTVYTLLADQGMVSFLTMGLTGDSMTRELDKGALFMITLSRDDRDRLIAAIKDRAGLEPEAEQEW